MLSDVSIALRLLLAAFLGSLIGFERERLLWAAGLRTHMLVSVGSCLIMIVSAYGFADVLGPHVILDPSRVAAQVVSGIGFLGAGSIIFRNEVVKGLTTAASLWVVAALGLAVGGGLYFAAGAATAIVLVILAGLKPLEERFRSQRRAARLDLEVAPGTMSAGFLQEVLGWRAQRVKQMVVTSHDGDDVDHVTLTLGNQPAKDTEEMIQLLSSRASVRDVQKA
ncbi:MAG TPA: MgtC/SapB family protein [Caulobacteraceae bacterium]|jgi:putative Mg2+ transporter-C (MgtC) family protein|nr:MgtC/SapB family protein [Caulobacteraceae bacterium]